MKSTPSKLERERDAWKARALSAEAVLAAAATDILESWRAARAKARHDRHIEITQGSR